VSFRNAVFLHTEVVLENRWKINVEGLQIKRNDGSVLKLNGRGPHYIGDAVGQ
jgi:hypothetical protein